jgi:hypothetical protein
MGREGVAFTAPGASGNTNTTLVPKKGAQAGDPTAGGKGIRANVPYTGERKGAAYGISAVRYTKMTDPTAGETQANGIIINTATNRSRSNFDAGSGASY